MSKKIYQQALDSGSIIESFEIIDVLGVGGFGITYKAIDNDLHHEVAIKEYLPSDFGWRIEGQTVVPKSSDVVKEYEYGLEKFLDEGRTLAKFKHPNIVRVSRFLRANGTGYLVMDYEYGQTLHQYLASNPQPDEETLLMVMISVLKGLTHIHSNGFLHRDIKPGNIYMRKEGEALLIDFGAARFSVGEHSHTMTGIVTAGYAPYEQYSLRAKQGPACDIYALGASLYRALSGAPPVESPDRITCLQESEQDPLISTLQLGLSGYNERFLQTIDWMLQPFPKDRPQSAEDVLHYLFPENLENGLDEEKVTVHVLPHTHSKRLDRSVSSGYVAAEKVSSEKAPNVFQEMKSRSASTLEPQDGQKKSLLKNPTVLMTIFSLTTLIIVILLIFTGTDNQNPSTASDTPPATLTSVEIKDKAAVGYVSIVTRPAGAKVYIDGKYAGRTPYHKKQIAVGRHIIALEKSNYVMYKRPINVVKNNSESLDLLLKPIVKRVFNITTNPAQATIKFLNKKLIYRQGIKLATGHYDLSISAAGYKTRRIEVRLLSSDPASYKINVSLYDKNFVQKYNLRQYGRITALKYVSPLKYLLVSTIYGELIIIDINPLATTESGSSTSSTQKSQYSSSLEGSPLAYRVVARFKTYQGKAFAVSNDNTRVYIGTHEGKVLLYDMVTRKIVAIYKSAHNTSSLVRAITISHDEKKMAVVVGTDLQIWNLRTKKLMLSGSLGYKVSQIILSKDKRSLLVYPWYKPYFDRISLLNSNFSPLQRYSGNDKGLNNMVMSSDRKMVFAEGPNYIIKAWNLKTSNIVRSYKGHSDSVNYIALRAGKLYSAGRDQTLRVWDVNTTKQIAVLQGHRTILGAVAVAPDGTIFSGDDKGQVFLWKLKE